MQSPGTPSPALSPSASPDALVIDDPAYLAGDAFTVSVDQAGTDWTAPSAAPVMPNGERAVRVAFLPASCATGTFTIRADDVPADAWETDLQADGDRHGYEFMSWPAAQPSQCADGHGEAYFRVAYHPFTLHGAIHLVADIRNVVDAPNAVEVVPVFTSADATQPSLTTVGFFALEQVPGPEKRRSAKAKEMAATDFDRTTLPDGTTPTHWGLRLTGCGPMGAEPIFITAQIGDAAPVDVGTCSDGSIRVEEMSLPLAVNGTRFAVLVAGGTTKSQVRVSEFQFRGDRP